MIGRACDLLMDAAEGIEPAGEQVLPFQLIKRETTGLAPR